MSGEIASGVLLGLAVAVVLVSSLGVLVMRDAYQRLHYVAPISLLAPLLVALAVTLHEGWDENTGAAWLAVGVVVLVSPIISHATIRAARIREYGDWREPSAGRNGGGGDSDGRGRG